MHNAEESSSGSVVTSHPTIARKGGGEEIGMRRVAKLDLLMAQQGTDLSLSANFMKIGGDKANTALTRLGRELTILRAGSRESE